MTIVVETWCFIFGICSSEVLRSDGIRATSDYPLRSKYIFLFWCAVVLILVNQWLDKGLDSMFDHSQLVGGTWWGAYTALCFSCGYFAYDQWDMLRYRLYSGWIPSILVHHLTLLVCFTLALYRNVTINYLILSLVCEVNIILSFSIYCLK